mmetsp:Transcript_3227/g.6128  ORF Transcript_3227/g.6128 Transcript_3227/m.6128 type:complete len:92 (-) Transcript_3227:131-406(-)
MEAEGFLVGWLKSSPSSGINSSDECVHATSPPMDSRVLARGTGAEASQPLGVRTQYIQKYLKAVRKAIENNTCAYANGTGSLGDEYKKTAL